MIKNVLVKEKKWEHKKYSVSQKYGLWESWSARQYLDFLWAVDEMPHSSHVRRLCFHEAFLCRRWNLSVLGGANECQISGLNSRLFITYPSELVSLGNHPTKSQTSQTMQFCFPLFFCSFCCFCVKSWQLKVVRQTSTSRARFEHIEALLWL